MIDSARMQALLVTVVYLLAVKDILFVSFSSVIGANKDTRRDTARNGRVRWLCDQATNLQASCGAITSHSSALYKSRQKFTNKVIILLT